MAIKGIALGRQTKVINHNNTNKELIAQEVAQIINATELTQTAFATKAEISASTIQKLFSPDYNRMPSATVLLKISKFSDTPVQTYEHLMSLAGHDIQKHPFEEIAIKSKKTDISQKYKNQIIAEIVTALTSMVQLARSDENKYFEIIFNLNSSYYKQWKIAYFISPSLDKAIDKTVTQNFIWKVLEDKENTTIKYSIFAPTQNLQTFLQELNLEGVNIPISCLSLNNDNKIIETYLHTSVPASSVEEISL